MDGAESILIRVLPDGSVELKGEGFKGSRCEILRRIAEKLGKVTDHKKTHEYFEQDVSQQQMQGGA